MSVSRYGKRADLIVHEQEPARPRVRVRVRTGA
jgi:hypothetical protein